VSEPIAAAGPELPVAAVVDAAHAAAARLRSGACPPSYLAELDARFEHAAREALAEPALLERSLQLRQVVRRVLPERLHPAARRVAAEADAAARRWPALGRVGQELAGQVHGVVTEVAALQGPARAMLRRADSAARANPAVHGALHNLAGMIERSAASDELPPALRRAARLAECAVQWARSELR
jgi:hypothetical protein